MSASSLPKYALALGQQTIPLGRGTSTIGRRSSCTVVLDDQVASRRHAQIVVDEAGVTISDLGSANGVFVNGARLSGPTRLRVGDRIFIGAHELTLVEGGKTRASGAHAVTVEDARRPNASEDDGPMSGARTVRADAFKVLCGLADKMFVQQRGAEAERALESHLANILAQVETAKGELAPDTLERAGLYAAKLGGATGKAKWANYPLRLFAALQKPMPLPVIDELYSVARQVPIDLAALRRYLEQLRQVSANFDASEGFLLRRLEGLEGLVAAR